MKRFYAMIGIVLLAGFGLWNVRQPKKGQTASLIDSGACFNAVDVGSNIVLDPSFEDTSIVNPYNGNKWAVYNNTSLAGQFDAKAPIPNWSNIELHKTGFIGSAAAGSQYGVINGHGSGPIAQNLNGRLKGGKIYRFRFAYALRPDKGFQSVQVSWDGAIIESIEGTPPAGATGLTWKYYEYYLTAHMSGAGGIGFVPTPNQYGEPANAGFVDDISVVELKCPNSACADGSDNDMDGFVDYPADAECSGIFDDNEGFVCGDGNKAWSEQCDDGNTTDGDGCSANCMTEVRAAAPTQPIPADTFTATGPNGEKPNANGIIRLQKGDDITLQWNFPGKQCIAGEGNNDWYYGEGLDPTTSGNITQGTAGTVTLHNRQRIESYTLECHLQFSAIWQIPLISKTIILVFDNLDFAPPAPNTFEIIGSNGSRMNAAGQLTIPIGTDVIVQWNYPNNVCVPQQPPSPNELYSAAEWNPQWQTVGVINQESVGVRVLRARTQNESYRIKCDKDSTFMVLNEPTPIDETRSVLIGTLVTTGGTSSGAGTSRVASLPAGSIQGPSVCDTVCGDGVVMGDELCDDGNAINTDACNNNCGRTSSSSSSSSSFAFSSSTSSLTACIPGTICPSGDICPQNGFCPPTSSSSSSSRSSAGACVPGTICPNNAVCPQNGECPGICIPGTICPTGELCPQNGLCPVASSSSSSSSQGFESCDINADCASNLCLGGYCSCTGSEQCGGNACIGGFCASIPASSDLISLMACGADTQCPAGMLCQEGFCAPNFALCGNGIQDPGELCDDGNGIENDSCSNACKLGNGSQCDNPRQCQSLICKDGVCSPCVADNECPDDMACVDGICSAVNPLDPDGDGMVVLSDGFKIAASLFSQLGADLRPENLSYEDYILLMQQHAAGHAPVGSTGPESVAVVAAGASAGYAWMKMRKMKKRQ